LQDLWGKAFDDLVILTASSVIGSFNKLISPTDIIASSHEMSSTCWRQAGQAVGTAGGWLMVLALAKAAMPVRAGVSMVGARRGRRRKGKKAAAAGRAIFLRTPRPHPHSGGGARTRRGRRKKRDERKLKMTPALYD